MPNFSAVFISYAHRDGRDLAEQLERDLTTSGFEVWLDRRRLLGGDAWGKEIETAIDRCDVAVALLSTGSYESDICRAEQERSLAKRKLVIPVRIQRDCDVPLSLQTRQYVDFSDSTSYASSLQNLQDSIRARRGVVAPAMSRSRHDNSPALPDNFVNRPAILAALRDALFQEAPHRNIALTALQGMGGIGKTVLAQALCHDEVVQQAYPDGTFWFTIGREAGLRFDQRIERVPGLKQLLGAFDGEHACVSQYRNALRGKAALIVLDDVWRVCDIEQFRAESQRSRLLITTRDTRIAPTFGAREFTAEFPTGGEARQVLARWAGVQNPEALPPQAEGVISECKNLPLALAMIGARLKGRPAIHWDIVLGDLRRADMARIGALFPEPHTTLFRAIQVSFEALKEADSVAAQRYLALAVILEDMVVAPAIQQTLWNVDETEAFETADRLVGLSLAQREREGGIRLHDLLLDYVRAQYSDREALDLIHGALRLSSHVIARDPSQFASQMAGRLLAYVQPINAVQQLAGSAARAAPRLVHAALCLPLFLIAQSPLRLASRIMTYLRAYVKPIAPVSEFFSSVVRGAPRPWPRPLQPALYPPGTGLVRTLAGDSNFENVALTEDGSRVVSTSFKMVTVWDLEAGRQLFSKPVDLGMFPHVVVSGDGRRAASTSLTGSIHVWDVETGRELHTLSSDLVFYNSVSMSGDGRQVVSASKNTVRVWDCETGRELHVLAGHLKDVECVAVSGDGRRAMSSSSDDTVKVWDLEASRELRSFTVRDSYRCNLALSGNGRRAVYATSSDLTMWDVETGRELQCQHDHLWGGEEVHAPRLAVSWDGRIAVSAAPHDENVKVWDLETGRELHALSGNLGGVLDVAVSRDGQLAVTACKDETLKVWHLGKSRDLRPMPGHRRSVVSVAASGNGRRAVSASEDHTLRLWDLKTGHQLRTINENSSSVAVSFDGRRAVSAWLHISFLHRFRYGVRVWNARMGLKKLTLAGHSKSVVAVALSRDGRRAVSASQDLTLKVWDLKTGRELWTLTGQSEPADGLAMSGDGRRAVSTSAHKALTVWDLDSGRELRTITDESKAFRAVKVTSEGQRAVSASGWRYELTVWDLECGCELRTWAAHSEYITDLAVSADGQWVVSSSYDKTVKVWRLSTGELVTTFTCDAPALCCSFGGHDRVVAGDKLGRVHFLSLELDERNG